MGILTGALLVAIIGKCKSLWDKKNSNLENFDELIGKIGNPVKIETELEKLSIQAKKLKNNSIYLQILSQIALMQAVQKKFNQAQTTIDLAQKQLQPDDHVAAARILLEQGRILQQAGNNEQALHYFDKSYQLSKLHTLDYHTINAAHMIAIVAPTLQEKIIWNELALARTQQSTDKKAHQWLAPLQNNLGQNYFDAQNYEKSLEHYEHALILFQNDPRYSSTIFARWTIARCKRALNKIDQALETQRQLLNQMQKLEQSQQYDMPSEMFFLILGWIYEELAEIYYLQNDIQKTKEYALLALTKLENNEMLRTTSPERIERLKKLI